MSQLDARNLSLSRSEHCVLDGVSCTVRAGELVVLLGPNGAGKTTLLRLLLGLLKPDGGTVQLEGRPVLAWSAMERARRLAYLPQQPELGWPVRVADIVALGRFAYGAAPGRLAPADRAAVQQALADCELADLAARPASTLSGGEQARMHCARAFAASTPLLLADEPTASLDPLHQHRVLRLFRAYVERGGGALLVLHDVALAARYADRLLWLRNGCLIADGSVEDTLSVERLADVYGVRGEVSGRRVLIDGEC